MFRRLFSFSVHFSAPKRTVLAVKKRKISYVCTQCCVLLTRTKWISQFYAISVIYSYVGITRLLPSNEFSA